MPNTLRQAFFLALAVAGLLLTWYHNLMFMAEHGTSLAVFLEYAAANHAASSLAWDVTVAFIAYVLWLPIEARRLGIRHWWLFFVLGLCLAMAVSFPLFLFVRERRLHKLQAAESRT